MGIPPLDPKLHCQTCWDTRGERRPVTTTYRDQGFCDHCRSWVEPQRNFDHVIAAFPQALRRAKAASGLKSKTIAQRAGLSEQAVSLYMKEDQPTTPGLEAFGRLCLAMRTHPNELLGFVDPRRRSAEALNERYGQAALKILEAMNGIGLHLGDRPDTGLATGTRREREEANPYTEAEV